MKYTPERVQEICELIGTGKYTVESICEKVDITKETFYQWKKEKADFSDSIKKAEKRKLKSIKDVALSSLYKLVSGYSYTETTLEAGKPVKLVKKHIAPNVTAVIFTLANLDSRSFKRQDKKEQANQEFLKPLHDEDTDQRETT